uniref:AlNc14C27G2636 protein n=1 Tax=Albugo laibachii Nc14 TaxID=890382 RepID=F0W704_9STRA|nr:AlNc14C27G2636 [Albugo laibachii Nc14]|eukprot:CCA16899.1 AlNc14C27G2636 [Albugo laibachii Nc14]
MPQIIWRWKSTVRMDIAGVDKEFLRCGESVLHDDSPTEVATVHQFFASPRNDVPLSIAWERFEKTISLQQMSLILAISWYF